MGVECLLADVPRYPSDELKYLSVTSPLHMCQGRFPDHGHIVSQSTLIDACPLYGLKAGICQPYPLYPSPAITCNNV